MVPYLNKLEFPSVKVALCSFVEIGRVALEEKFLNFGNVFLVLLNELPLVKDVALH